MTTPLFNHTSSSFRDPAGFLFKVDQTLYRQVNREYRDHFDVLISSGLYQELEKNGDIIHHERVEVDFADPSRGYCVLQPEYLTFTSYPYEWCFNQLKDAALLTLHIQKTALDFRMTLKDASAYNIQFKGSKPLLIDTLSFEKYEEGKPWVAYRQFCQHFLAPLALMAYRDVRMNSLLKNYIDGIPLDLAAKLLPFKARLNSGLFSHIYLHAGAQKQYAAKQVSIEQQPHNFSRMSFLGLVDHLESTIRKLKNPGQQTEWGDYYDNTNYSSQAFNNKKRIIQEFVEKIQPKILWDLGANTGEFCHFSGNFPTYTLAFDIDHDAIEKHYSVCKEENLSNILPLCLDLTNPSPSIGWHNQERMSIIERGPADMVLALALIHHLAISNNVPFSMLSNFFADISRYLVIEFIPKTDSQVQRLLKSRVDIFSEYDQEHFECEMERCFHIRDKQPITDSQRTLYLMEKR